MKEFEFDTTIGCQHFPNCYVLCGQIKRQGYMNETTRPTKLAGDQNKLLNLILVRDSIHSRQAD